MDENKTRCNLCRELVDDDKMTEVGVCISCMAYLETLDEMKREQAEDCYA